MLKRSYLVVSESAETQEALAILLRSEGLAVSLAGNGADAIRVLRNETIDTVVIAVQRPGTKAAQLRSRVLQESPECRALIVSPVGAIRDASKSIRYAIGDHLLNERELISLLAAPHRGEHDEGSSGEDAGYHALTQTIEVLVGLQELGDQHFAGSSQRAMRLARAVAEEMKLEREMIHGVVLATLLRDIGKVGIENQVLEEDGSFSEEQHEEMRKHVTGSVRLLEHIDYPWKVLPIIRHHHERYDGHGYPDGLRGPEIPLGARILAVVDAYVAMMSGRSYRERVPSDHALAELERGAGLQFDPEVVEVLMRVIDDHSADAGRDQQPKVLIADPDDEFLNLLKMRLLNEGMEVRVENCLDRALLTVIEDPPDLILAGIGDSEDGAFNGLKMIREDESLRHVPFAFLAPHSDRILRVKALRQGVDDYLVKSDELEELVTRIQNIVVREAVRRAPRAAAKRRGISGQLENLPFADICQMLNLGLKTACVSLSAGKKSGTAWFDQGALVHAESGKTRGEDAIYAMLGWNDGDFMIEHGVRNGEMRTIENETMFVVMEGLRRLDESRDEKAAG